MKSPSPLSNFINLRQVGVVGWRTRRNRGGRIVEMKNIEVGKKDVGGMRWKKGRGYGWV
jgi:hypothetical protein